MQKRPSHAYLEVLHCFAGIFPLFTEASGNGPWKFIIVRVEMLQEVYRLFFPPVKPPFHSGSQLNTEDHCLDI